jgi:UDPglucose 6-dehydrogenase
MRIGFIGIGKLGKDAAEVMYEAGHDVLGYDTRIVKDCKHEMTFVLEDVCRHGEIIFIAVPTPHHPDYDGRYPTSHLPNKDFDYSIVKDVLAEINKYTTKDQLVVLISTVLPGTIKREFIPLVKNYRFIYNPYLIAMGTVKQDMIRPEMIIVGTEDGTQTGDASKLAEFYGTFVYPKTRYEVGTWDEAEAIKIFYNTFISTKIGLVNMIQDVAMKSGNINVDVVTDALASSDMRIISKKYMTAGMGDAGPCHPRDNIALRWLAENLDLGYDIFDTVMHAREQQARNLAVYLHRLQQNNNLPIIIHGKAYKPDVDMVDGSYSLLIGSYLDSMGSEYCYWDPLTGDRLPDSVPAIILLAHNRQVTYGYTGELTEQQLYFNLSGGSIVVDPWRTFTTDAENIKVIHYGNTRLHDNN